MTTPAVYCRQSIRYHFSLEFASCEGIKGLPPCHAEHAFKLKRVAERVASVGTVATSTMQKTKHCDQPGSNHKVVKECMMLYAAKTNESNDLDSHRSVPARRPPDNPSSSSKLREVSDYEFDSAAYAGPGHGERLHPGRQHR